MKMNSMYLVTIIRVRNNYSTKVAYEFGTDDSIDATAEFEVMIKNETRFLSSANDPKHNKDYMFSVITLFSKMKGVLNQATIVKYNPKHN